MHTSALESLGVINHTIFQLFFKIKIQEQPIFITEVTKQNNGEALWERKVMRSVELTSFISTCEGALGCRFELD